MTASTVTPAVRKLRRMESTVGFSSGAFQQMVCSTRPSALASAATMSTLATSMAKTSLPPRSACEMLWG
jgi:hypothetical protein